MCCHAVPPSQIASASRQSTSKAPPVPAKHLGFLLRQPVFLLLGAEHKHTFKISFTLTPPPTPHPHMLATLTCARQHHLGSGRRRRVLGDVPGLGGGLQVQVCTCAVHHLLIGLEGGLRVHGHRVVGRRELVLRGKKEDVVEQSHLEARRVIFSRFLVVMAELMVHCPLNIPATTVKFSPGKQIYTQDLFSLNAMSKRWFSQGYFLSVFVLSSALTFMTNSLVAFFYFFLIYLNVFCFVFSFEETWVESMWPRFLIRLFVTSQWLATAS